MIAAWRGELWKVRTVRGLWLGALLAALAIPVVSLLVVATGGLGADDTAVSGAATGTIVGLLGFAAWGAAVATSEYSQGTIVVSLAAVPDRRRFLGAKLLAAATVAAAGSAAAALASLLVVVAVTPPDDHVGTGNPAALLGLVLAATAVAVAGAAVGLLTRSPQGATAVVVAAILLPKAAADLLGGLERWVVGASPGTVVTQVVEGGQLSSSQQFPGGAAAAALAMVAVVGVVAATAAIDFARRDG